eukprot:9121170-Karenia_brevis.AAC.1
MANAVAFDARVAMIKLVYAELVKAWARVEVPEAVLEGSVQWSRQPSSPVAKSFPWQLMDGIDLGEVYLRRARWLQACPEFLRGPWRQALSIALEERRRHKLAGNTEGLERAWKLFLLLPTMLLRTPRRWGYVGKEELTKRFDDFTRGRWE